MCSWDFSTQRTLGLLGAEQKLEEKDYLIDLKPLRAYVTEAFVEECQKYEEWIYLCLKIVLAEENLGLSLAYFVQILGSGSRENVFHLNFEDIMTTKQVNFLEYVFTLFQQTVEKKIHFSVIIEAKTEKIEQDEYYGFSADEKDRGNGLQIHMSDLDWILQQFDDQCTLLFSRKVDQNSFSEEANGPEIEQLDVEERWSFEHATNLVESIHWMLKLMIPVNFLGGYLSEIQSKFIPRTLDILCQLLIYLDKNFNRDVIVKNSSGEVKGVMRQSQPSKPLSGLPELYPDNQDTSKQLKTLPLRAFFSLVTDILRLSSTLVHVNLSASAHIFDKGYHIPLLSFSAYDRLNPLTRESTVLLIRYLTDSNERGKQEIGKLDVKRLDEDGIKQWNDFCKDMQKKEAGGYFM